MAATAVDEIDRLLDAGATQLALRVIAEEQPEYATHPVAWQRWERRRLAILESRRAWPAVIERVAAYPATLPDDFWVSAQEALARARLAAGDATAAARIVAGLIWGAAQDTALSQERIERMTRWRTLLADSYLLAGRLADAQTSELRFRLDYGRDPEGWRLALAKAFIRTGRDREARELLVGLETTEVDYLELLLRARDASVDPVELLAAMAPFLGEGRLLAAERAQLWASLGTAAARYRDHEVRATAMEQALALRSPVAARDRFVSVDGDALWDAYDDYAAALANDARLLVGRFDDWLALAEQHAQGDALAARALYAYLSIQEQDPRVADLARERLVAALASQSHGLRILAGLYLDNRRYAQISAVPAALRAPLIAYAVTVSRPDLAVDLLAQMSPEARREAPPQWRSAVAITLINNGKIDEALVLLKADFNSMEGLPKSAKAAAIEVARALQAAGEQQRAAALLARALAAAGDPWERRELALLSAEAEDRAGHPDRAARLYIESAAVPGGSAPDVWSRMARLEAAGALTRGGLADDAEAVTQSALGDGPGPEERVWLEHGRRPR
jgi:hypothetical protein